jgi:hypothetical protein
VGIEEVEILELEVVVGNFKRDIYIHGDPCKVAYL